MKIQIGKHFGDGLLIVFSVLFALFINQSFEDYKTRQKKEIARESIRKELYRNQYILKSWKVKHIEIRDKINGMLLGTEDSLVAELKNYDYLNLGILTNNESLIDAILTSTAWESAKTTEIISEFDYETIQKLTFVYSMQEILTERTLMKILDYYFDTESHDIENLDKTLIQFQLRFHELTGQEELMTNLVEEAIQEIEGMN